MQKGQARIDALLDSTCYPWGQNELYDIGPHDLEPCYQASGRVFFLPRLDAVLKTGPYLMPGEIGVQLYAANHGLAVPVWYFGRVPDLHPAVHNYLHQFKPIYTYQKYYVTIMPRGKDLPPKDAVPDNFVDQVDQFMDGVVSFLWDELNWTDWEAAPRHVKIYNEKLVAIDFEGRFGG